MKIEQLLPNQIITLNDYPVYSNEALVEYFEKSKSGEELPFVPVIRKNIVREYLGDKLSKIFEEFEKTNPKAEYFMIDGSHRTTALTVTKHKINAIIYEKDEDIIEAKKLVINGQILQNGTLEHTIKKNCKILNEHFNKKSYFMTVEQKTIKMVEEKTIPNNIINYYTKNK